MTSTHQRRVNRDSNEYTQKSFELLLSTLKRHGCNPQRAPDKQAVLISQCPLPDCNGNTPTPLQVDTRTGRYHCRSCRAEGTPTTFLARRWQVAASHAHALIEHYPVDQMLDGRPPMTPAMLAERIDTFPLGAAMRHYSSELTKHYPAIQWLAKLSLNPTEARRAHIGYSSGDGLEEALASEGVTGEQVASARLLRPATGQDRFAGSIVIADTDHTGAVTWLVSTGPNRDNEVPGLRINPQQPPVHCLPFHNRSATIGLNNVSNRSKPALLTDDVRTYAVAAAKEIQTLLTIRRNRNETPEVTQRRLDITAQTILSRARMSALVIAVHDPALAIGLRDRIAASRPDLPVLADTRALALRIASPATRNLHSLFDVDTFAQRAQAARQRLDAYLSSNAEPQEKGETNERSPDNADG